MKLSDLKVGEVYVLAAKSVDYKKLPKGLVEKLLVELKEVKTYQQWSGSFKPNYVFEFVTKENKKIIDSLSLHPYDKRYWSNRHVVTYSEGDVLKRIKPMGTPIESMPIW